MWNYIMLFALYNSTYYNITSPPVYYNKESSLPKNEEILKFFRCRDKANNF